MNATQSNILEARQSFEKFATDKNPTIVPDSNPKSKEFFDISNFKPRGFLRSNTIDQADERDALYSEFSSRKHKSMLLADPSESNFSEEHNEGTEAGFGIAKKQKLSQQKD